MSKKFVQHLDGWYAQSHPVEDFAETFAIWIAPKSKWVSRYEGWPAMAKLEYVDELIIELSEQKPQVRTRAKPYSLSKLRHTLGTHYERRKAHYEPGISTAFDRDLFLMFSDESKYKNKESAASFLRRHRKIIREQVSLFTGEYQITVDQVLRAIIARCRELKLRITKSERQSRLDFAIMLAVHTVHTLHRRNEWHPL